MLDLFDPISIKAVADASYTFRLLDFTFTIGTNQPEAMVYFQKMYHGFSLQTAAQKDGVGTYYVINEPRFLNKPFIWADERIYPCPEYDMVSSYAYSVITNSIMARIKSYLIFHAAAVSRQGKGIIISGDSCQGKSTLTMELIRRGFKFFSDDITCIQRKNRFIYPFPRALSLRHSAIGLFKEFKGLIDADSDFLPKECGRKKVLMNLFSDVSKDKIADPCSVRFLICLSAHPQGEGEAGGGLADPLKEDKKYLYLVIDRFEDDLIRDLTALPEVKKIEKVEGKSCPVIKLTSRRGSFLLPRIERLCRKYQVALVNIAKDETKTIDYSQKPHLDKISKLTGLRELLRGFRGGWTSPVIQESSGGIASMLFELSHIMENVECYRLAPGRLSEMADLLDDLVAEKSGRDKEHRI